MDTKIVLAIVAFLLVLVTGAFLFRGSDKEQEIMSSSLLQSDENELAVFGKDIQTITEDESSVTQYI